MEDGPPMFRQDFTCPALLDIIHFQVSPTGLSPSLIKLSNLFGYHQCTLGLVPFRSPLLWESQLISFPPGT